MSQENNRCPLCSKKLVMKDGVPTCPDCGYRDPYSVGRQESCSDVTQQGGAQQTEGGQTAQDTRQPQGGGQYYSADDRVNAYLNRNEEYARASRETAAVNYQQGKEKKDHGSLIVGIVAGVVVLLAVLLGGVFWASYKLFNSYEGSGGDSLFSEDGGKDEPQPSGQTPGLLDEPEEDSGDSSGNRAKYRPKSAMMKELAELIFEKDVMDVTGEELYSVVYLDIYDLDNGGTAIDYELADGSQATCFMSFTDVDTTDLRCFGGLECLFLEDDTLDWDTDWHNLENLYVLGCESSLPEIAEVMDESQLIWLDLKCSITRSSEDVYGIERFENLMHLELETGFCLDSLEGLSKAPALRELVLRDADRIGDFSELYDMPQLELLSIESSGLRDIGFISGMEGLRELELKGSSVISIDSIEDRADTLTALRLHENYDVKDYSPALSCTGLEELELYAVSGAEEAVLPDLSAMTGLKRLSVAHFENLDNLSKLTWLEELTLDQDYIYGSGGGLFLGLDNLTSLSLIDLSLDGEALEHIGGLTGLETVDMTGSFLWGDIGVLFELPNLRYLYLNDADIGLAADGMAVSESLEVLDLEGTKFHHLLEDGSWDYKADNTRIGLADHMELFESCPNLQILYVPGHELDSVEFAAGMGQLYYLDITDNYVTDLSPLADADAIEVVVCSNNPIHDRTGMDDVILIE